MNRTCLSPDLADGRTGYAGPAVGLLRGFTLVELVMVTAILAIIMAVAAPYLRTPPTVKLVHKIAIVADAFRYARDTAIATNRLHGLHFELPNDSHPNHILLSIGHFSQSTFNVISHPVNHTPYVMALPITSTDGRQVHWTDGNINFDGACAAEVSTLIIFDGHGIPRCLSPYQTVLASASMTLSLRGKNSTIQIEEFTGRVVLQ